VLDLRKLTVIADFFVICSGESVTQVKAIADNIEGKLKERGVRPIGIEGEGHAHWVLIDYGDVVVHVFEDETRHYYELEKFWLDAPRIAINAEDKNSLAGKDKRQEPGRGD
jgi:ribosome-associated protein